MRLSILLAGSALSFFPPWNSASAAPDSNRQGQAGPATVISKPQGSVAGLITDEDYPADARDGDHEGAVVVRLQIDSRGRVTGCSVEESSGFESLDTQTCKLLQLRASYTPARDTRGRPVSASVAARINWRLEEALMPPQAWAIRSILVVNGRLARPTCAIETEGALVDRAELPWNCKKSLAELMPNANDLVGPGRINTLTTELRFVPGTTDKLPAAASKPGDVVISRQVTRLSIDERGDLTRCERTSLSGTYPMPKDRCSQSKERFLPLMNTKGRPIGFTGLLIETVQHREELAQ